MNLAMPAVHEATPLTFLGEEETQTRCTVEEIHGKRLIVVLDGPARPGAAIKLELGSHIVFGEIVGQVGKGSRNFHIIEALHAIPRQLPRIWFENERLDQVDERVPAPARSSNQGFMKLLAGIRQTAYPMRGPYGLEVEKAFRALEDKALRAVDANAQAQIAEAAIALVARHNEAVRANIQDILDRTNSLFSLLAFTFDSVDAGKARGASIRETQFGDQLRALGRDLMNVLQPVAQTTEV